MSFVQQSYLSVTDFEFYRTVVRQPVRRSLMYFLFLVTLAALFTAGIFSVRVYPKLDAVGTWLIENLPAMEVKEGKLSAAVSAPYRMTREDLGLRVVVDPSDLVREASKKEGLEVIFNSDRIYFQFQGREDAYVFRQRDNFRINRESLEVIRKMLKTVFMPLGLILLWPYYFVAKGLQLLFLMCCGLLLHRPEWSHLRWRQWLNIATYALTPAILIGMIFQATTVPAPIAWAFYIGTAMLYTLLAGRRGAAEIWNGESSE